MRIDSSFLPLPINQPAESGARLPVRGPQGLPAGDDQSVGGADGGFADILREALDRVNETQQQADVALQDVATGRADDLHEAIIALEKADLTLRLTAQVTQRAVEAYKEISRMQI
ncbi:MAG: flagellar hook-basal body complex protein FliE [Armatimonadia bacterium]|nr:flagellar hook-basal body complex protein FliE [Armatimonadia bacterium]